LISAAELDQELQNNASCMILTAREVVKMPDITSTISHPYD